MKYCTHCGTQLDDEVINCQACGHTADKVGGSSSPSKHNSILGTIAKVFMLITVASMALGGIMMVLILGIFFATSTGDALTSLVIVILFIYASFALGSLAWRIPMTVHVWKKLNKNEPISAAMKVCVLLLVNFVAGILLLCMNDFE